MHSPEQMTTLFDTLESDYDDLSNHWYAWLFSRPHYLIATRIIVPYQPNTVLDIGCGTGYQSFLHSYAGANVTGIDISHQMLATAQRKTDSANAQYHEQFPASYGYAHRYQHKVRTALAQLPATSWQPPNFIQGDAMHVPCADGAFDHVNCCGSTLSFVADHHAALHEMARVLRPGGSLLLEVESRWNADTWWTWADSMVGGKMYHASAQDLRQLIAQAPEEHADIVYHFGTDCIPMPLRLFTRIGLQQDLAKHGFAIQWKSSMHSLTNILPSPLLHTHRNDAIGQIFPMLAMIEERMPWLDWGSSLVVVAKKTT